MELKAKICYVKERHTISGRLGATDVRGVRLEWTEGETKNSLFVSLFGTHLDAFEALDPKVGETLEGELVFSVTERNGFFSNYVELRNPRRA